MERRKLGNSTLAVAPLAFGGNVFGWTVDEAHRLLDAFVDAGFNIIDTADVYSRWVPGNKGGESEAIIGKWIRKSGKRDAVVIATKVGMAAPPGDKGLSRANIRRTAEEALRRLQTDCIDLYQSHKDDTDTPLEETLAAYAELIKEGKVRAIGASNYSAPRLAEALDTGNRLGLPVYQSLQPEYNLYDRAGYERELEPLCRERNVGVIGYYSLASGFLTGKYRSKKDAAKSARGKTAAAYLDDRGLRILAALDDVAGQLGATPGAVALAWLIARPGVTAPIASATTLTQLAELAAAARLTLDRAAIARLDRASAYNGTGPKNG